MKKNKIIIFIIIIILIIITCIIIKLLLNTDNYKIKKGYKIYGSEICLLTTYKPKNIFELPYNIPGHYITKDTGIEYWPCNICHKKSQGSVGSGPVLCSDCAHITDRCNICGKLLSSE